MATTDKSAQSEQFLAFLRSPEAALVLREAGLEP
jgi:ABC-type molybdate transport system substrate-binding protein